MNDSIDWTQLGKEAQARSDADRAEKKLKDDEAEGVRKAEQEAWTRFFEKVLARFESMKSEARGIAVQYNRSVKEHALLMNVVDGLAKTEFTIRRGSGPVCVEFRFTDNALEVTPLQSSRRVAGGTTVYSIIDGEELKFLKGAQEVHPAQIINDACKFVVSAQAAD